MIPQKLKTCVAGLNNLFLLRTGKFDIFHKQKAIYMVFHSIKSLYTHDLT